MPLFTYAAPDYDRTYPHLRLDAVRGETYELDEMPADGLWEPADDEPADKPAKSKRTATDGD